MPIQIIPAIVPTVLINNLPAAVVTSMTLPCTMPGCVPGKPGTIIVGSATVMTGGMPAARLGDAVLFETCVGPIPCPTAKIIPPCSPNVIIGG